MKVRPAQSRGFTLLELLIVMTIIAVLAGGIFAAAQSAIKKARGAQALNMAAGLVKGINDYRGEYGRWPLPPGSTATDVTELESIGDIIELLLGKSPTALAANKKGINFLEGMPLAKDKRNGITFLSNGQQGEIHDPWGEPFLIYIDSNLDGELAHPEGGTDKLYSVRVAVLSTGNDKKKSADGPDSTDNKDNIRTW